MRPRSRPLLVAAVALLSFAPRAAADVVTVAPSRDNTVYEEDGTLSNGAGDHVFAGATKDGFLRRTLIAFDVAGALPAGSIVNSVRLDLYLSRTRTGDQTMTLHRVLATWGEGTSHASGEEGAGAPASSGDATWTHRLYPTATWSSAGGDLAATASGSALISNQSGFYSWSSAGMAADVQAWLDGTLANEGWILLGNEIDTRVAKRFDSRENDDGNRRPRLVVDFTPPALTGACCAADGSCSSVLDPGTDCTGTYQGTGTSCSPDPCPQPVGACCLPDASATCVEDTEAACTDQGGAFQGDFSACTDVECPVVLTPYVDALPRPAVAQPVSGTSGGQASYEIAMREVQQQLHRDLPPSTVWGYGDGSSGATYPGPTIEAGTAQPITVTWINDLRDTSLGGALRTEHYLPVDPCPHGAFQNADARTVVHLHGGHVPPAYDGYPESTFPPGSQVVYHYGNWQLPSTLWYHDHALGITRLNVYMGLAGFYLVRDPFEESLDLPDGEYEIPLVIQDRSFHPDGSLAYPADWADIFFGDTNLVNGKVMPYLDVDQGKYRFRILNGSNARTYRLSLSSGGAFQQIGAEGGLLPAPVTHFELLLGPAERADVVIDFEPYPAGTEILLTNDAPAPFPGDPGAGVVPDVMKFVVTSGAGDTDPLPSTLRPMEVLQEADATQHRELHLEKGAGDACSPFSWEVRSIVSGAIAGQKWVDITEYPELGETEVWKFVNKSGLTHPMHMHLVMFQVLDRQAFDTDSQGNIVPIGSPVPPPPHEAGWKDTVQVGPNEIVRVIARFESYRGRFPYHCHILEHEDHEMMRQFEAVATVENCRDGIDNDGDGLTDFAGNDPGCDSDLDLSEHSPDRPCDDGIDNDGDGTTDYRADLDGDGISDPPGDIGCRGPSWSTENPACDDGLDNDGDGRIDWDGAGLTEPDAQCNGLPYRLREKRRSRCGTGFEVALVLLAVAGLRRARAAVRSD